MLTAAAVDAVERDRVTRPIAEVARHLQDHLGQKMTAYLAGLKDPKVVGQWAAARATPRPLAEMRLRCSYEAVRLIGTAHGDETVRAWLFGSNRRLDDEAPAYVLRHAQGVDDLRQIVPVARAFAGAAD
jgi:hypothetical protein